MPKMDFKLKDTITLFKDTYNEWSEDEAFDLSAAVAYYSIFSLPPLLLIVVALAGIFFGPDAVQGKITAEVGSTIGKQSAENIQAMISNAYKSGQSKIATIVGIATLIFSSTGLFYQLQKTLNKIWEVKANPKGGIKKLILDRATSLGIVLAVGFLLLISMVITTMVNAFSDWIMHMLPHFVIYLFYVVNFLLSFVVITALFALIYKFLPDVRMEWRSVWVGAAITALLFVIGKFGLGLYFRFGNPVSTFGAAGSVILILLWIYYSCLILFFGAEFTQVYARRYGHSVEPSAHAVRIKKIAVEGQEEKKEFTKG